MGARSFVPPGMIQTPAQAQTAGRARAAGSRPRRSRRTKRTSSRTTAKAARRRGKPRPGTKAWMTYIRGKRGKKKKSK
jgi:hypothetical protein